VGRPFPQVYLIGVLKDLPRREVRQMLARVYISQGRHHEAEAQIQRCLAEFPDYTIGWTTLGYVYVHTEDWKRLDFVIRQLSKCDNGVAFGLILRCVAACKNGRRTEARQWIERAVEAAPHLYESRYLMAQLKSEMHDPPVDQLSAWREVLRIAPVCSYARAAVATLQRHTTESLETVSPTNETTEIPLTTKIDVGTFVASM
jgi:tetratricopeptide (TPR) repeat protein